MYTVQLCRLSGRLREQARSHSWIAVRQIDQRRLSGRHGSKLPRHRFSVAPKLCRYLCCDGGRSATEMLTDSPPSQASQLPHQALCATADKEDSVLGME